jgi:N-acetyl-alpha-D-glucosaminyl L-malate synthase BshA
LKIGISCYPTFGGSGVVATELAMALAEAGDEVHVISYALPSRLAFLNPRLFYHEVTVPRYPLFEYPPYSLALATTMVEVARHQNLDLLHVHYAVPNAVSAVLARQMMAPRPLPVVTTLHGTDVTLVGIDPNYRATTRFGIVESDAVTAVSEALRAITLDQLGIDKPIEVIYNFVDPARFDPALCDPVHGHPGARRWAQPGEKLMVHISNFRPLKRVLDVVEIYRRVRQHLPVRLLMVGDGPERPIAERACREHGICDGITFIGTIPMVEEALIGADLFVLTSETESFGLAVLEAMACGVPVVATRTGGLPEVVVDGETGFLRPVGDVDSMAAAAEAILTDDGLAQRLAIAGRQRAIEEFGQAKMVGRYRSLYERVLAGVPSG